MIHMLYKFICVNWFWQGKSKQPTQNQLRSRRPGAQTWQHVLQILVQEAPWLLVGSTTLRGGGGQCDAKLVSQLIHVLGKVFCSRSPSSSKFYVIFWKRILSKWPKESVFFGFEITQICGLGLIKPLIPQQSHWVVRYLQCRMDKNLMFLGYATLWEGI